MITLCVGIFFLVLALVFAIAAWKDNRSAGGILIPASKTRRRVAVIFCLVGLGLVLLHLNS